MDFENCWHWWLFKTYNHNSREWFLLVLHFYSSFKNDLPIHISWLCSRPSSFQNVLCIFQNLNKSNNWKTNSHPQVLTMISALLFVDYEWCHVLFNNNTVIFLHHIWYHHILLNIHVIHYGYIVTNLSVPGLLLIRIIYSFLLS